tara:strand:+ start:300 stop:794 length:495 start_codon:yes stop_codon:yes gene_type:complete
MKKKVQKLYLPSQPLKILVANGVNLDLLGKRDSSHYGNFTLSELEADILSRKNRLSTFFDYPIELNFIQSNDEPKFLEFLSKEWDGILLNAGAWTHTSLALADRLESLGTPFVEIHISNLSKRESFRHFSFLSPIAVGTISGFGKESYHSGLYSLVSFLIKGKG